MNWLQQKIATVDLRKKNKKDQINVNTTTTVKYSDNGQMVRCNNSFDKFTYLIGKQSMNQII